VTYERQRQLRNGIVLGDHIMDVPAAVELFTKPERSFGTWVKQVNIDAKSAKLLSSRPSPRNMVELLEYGETWRVALGSAAAGLAALPRKQLPKGLFLLLSRARLRAPIDMPGKITCVGLNYSDHAQEVGMKSPSSPIFFLKSANTISGPGEPIILPPNSTQVDYEAELAVVIGKRGRRIPENEAHEYIAGYTIMNDVSARDMQFGDQQWFRGKSCDTFAPMGPWIVTREEVADPHQLRISLDLNGERMQDSNTANLIFKIPQLISFLSQSVTWEVGDLILTGTPSGVGISRKPPVFVKAGDIITISVDKIGCLTNPVEGL
jgi:2-keto-4-pentenoate hydratase/2-oxohepta-3-ene-1,7-dioic acid hydratase in catechol pathway